MKELSQLVNDSFSPNTYFCVLSNVVNKDEMYNRIEFKLLNGKYVVEKYTAKQVFHSHMLFEEAVTYIRELMGSTYRNLNAWEGTYEYSIRLSKKGKVFANRRVKSESSPKQHTTHNRTKKSIIPEGTFIEPLFDMGILSKDGTVIKKMYGKFRQINRFIEIIDDALEQNGKDTLNVLDFGCGKSYLTFLLYYYFTQIRKIKVNMIGLDLKEDVIEKCNASAHKYGYGNLKFQIGDIARYEHQGDLDMVLSLHACDTATDYALFNAIKWKARMIFAVPCCQHELNQQINSDRLSILTDYGLIKERFSALSTDAIRGNLLKCCGYKVQLLEFVDFDHTPKNLMIRAVRTNIDNTYKTSALAAVDALMDEFQFQPVLYTLLKEAGYLTNEYQRGANK